MKKKEKGITLIALVVTIVILLILASISIGALTGDNGIIDQAHTAKEDTEIASWEEQIDLAIIDAEKKHRNPTLDDVKEELKNKGIITNNEQVKENGDIETNEPTYIITGKLDDYLPRIPQGLEIGSEVEYTPAGTYPWLAKYYYYESEENPDITLDSSKDDFKISSWKVLDINKDTEEITLIASEPTSGTVKLGGAQGYNNGVYLLNEACSKLYGNEEKGIKARSINIEDIEHYMTDEALEEAHNYQSTTGKIKYGEQSKNIFDYFKYYPIIYREEEKSVINGNEKKDGLNLSEQSKLIEPTLISDINNGNIEATSSIQPYQTLWQKDLTETDFKNIENSKLIKNYYELIMIRNSGVIYWIASRGISNDIGIGHFRIYEKIIGVDSTEVYSSANGSYNESNRLFPIVTLQGELITGNSENGYKVEI